MSMSYNCKPEMHAYIYTYLKFRWLFYLQASQLVSNN